MIITLKHIIAQKFKQKIKIVIRLFARIRDIINLEKPRVPEYLRSVPFLFVCLIFCFGVNEIRPAQ